MDGIMRNQQNYVANTTNSHALYLHKNSKIVTKLKPKIRIIHIFPPKIIKTNVENFRDLVQRLTGKPTSCKIKEKRVMRATRPRKVDLQPTRFSEFRAKIKGEEEIWGDAMNQNNSGFLSEFADLGGFMQELDRVQMLPMDVNSSNMNSIGGTRYF